MKRTDRLYIFLICVVLILATLAVYLPIRNYSFVNFDDNIYVTENQHVKAGFTRASVTWAFTKGGDVTYWHPLTWLSHMLDYQLFGSKAGMHHLTSLVLHIANTLLLFWVFRRLTGAVWKSAFVAALFALHPINVDSVVWIAERKNLLSAFFWMLALLTYVRYCRRPGPRRYLPVLLMFVLALLSKPTVVTLPFVFLLLDYWPLGRLRLERLGSIGKKTSKSVKTGGEGPSVLNLVLEKVPFFILSAVSILLSSLSAHERAVSAASVPIKLRIANTLVSYVNYVGKMVWPQNLAVFYPYPKTVPLWQSIGALLLLAFASILVIRMLKKMPFLTAGWFWYLGTLLPVIGLVQVGLWPAMADRFAYLPLIGLFAVVAWIVPYLLAGWQYQKIVLGISAAVVLTILFICTANQVRYWQSSITLAEHDLKVTQGNYVMHNNIAIALGSQHKYDDAVSHLLAALQLAPNYARSHYNLGVTLKFQGKFDEAISHFRQAVRLEPDYAQAYNNLGSVLASQGKFDEALTCVQRAIKLVPDYAEAYSNLGSILGGQGRLDQSIGHLHRALALEPDCAEAHNNLGIVFKMQGRLDEAADQFRQALQTDPNYAKANYNLGIVLKSQGKLDQAIAHFERALAEKPDDADAQNNIGDALGLAGRFDEALAHFRRAVSLKPDYLPALSSIARILVLHPDPNVRDANEAVFFAERAAKLSEYKNPFVLGTLADAYAAAGWFDKAADIAQKAIDLASAVDDKLADHLRKRLELFRQGRQKP